MVLGRLCTGELWQAEIVPVLLFGMTVAIAFWRELALVLTAAMALTLCLALGMGLAEFVLMVATGSAAVLLLNRVRSRTKMIYVGLGAGLVAILTTIGVGSLIGEPLGSWSSTDLLAVDRWTRWRLAVRRPSPGRRRVARILCRPGGLDHDRPAAVHRTVV